LRTMLTVFLPTLLMVTVALTTSYFQPFFFEASMTVNLTVMLVLATMFLDISGSEVLLIHTRSGKVIR
jgi:hypothetical protein